MHGRKPVGTRRAPERVLQLTTKTPYPSKVRTRVVIYLLERERDKKKVGITNQREVMIKVRGQRYPLFKVRESPREARDRNRKDGAHIRKGV